MRILVFQHLEVEHPGVFRDIWKAKGQTWTSVELDRGEEIPDLALFDLLVVMGGPMDVWQVDLHPWLATEKLAIRRWVKDLGKPYLGVCLGHQLLADALDGEVRLMAKPEVGIAGVELTPAGQVDPLFRGFRPSFQTLQWHGAEVSRLPQGATLLAANAACPVQAFRWGAHAYGFQYHTEVTASTVGEWETIPEYGESLDRALGAGAARRLEEELTPLLASFRSSAQLIDRNLSALMVG